MSTHAGKPRLTGLYDLITGDEDARVCRDIPEAACNDQPRNFFLHLGALAATKSGDLLASPKVVLPWLLATLGAPGTLTGLLVPLRESLALLPQLLVAGFMRAAPVRKWFWVAGALVQGLCVLAMAGLALTELAPVTAGWGIIALLAAFSLGRGVCSVASKDVLGKTVSKTRRGRVSGYAASAAGLIGIGVGLVVYVGVRPSAASLALLLAGAAMLWLLAAGLFAAVAEQPGATEGGGNAASHALASLRLLRTDTGLRRFIAVRALLVATALAAPYYVTLMHEQGTGATGLGLLLLATGLANTASASLWGRMADRASHRVLALAGLLGGAVSLGVTALAMMTLPPGLGSPVFALAFLLLSVAHSGVRMGRKTYLVDLANADNRAAYVALSNTLIGLILLAAGALLALLGTWLAPQLLVAGLGAAALAGAWAALRLPNVQSETQPEAD